MTVVATAAAAAAAAAASAVFICKLACESVFRCLCGNGGVTSDANTLACFAKTASVGYR
jgi:hypothetical protein